MKILKDNFQNYKKLYELSQMIPYDIRIEKIWKVIIYFELIEVDEYKILKRFEGEMI